MYSNIEYKGKTNNKIKKNINEKDKETIEINKYIEILFFYFLF